MQLFVKYFEGLTLKLAWLAAWLFVLSGIMLSYEVVAPLLFFSTNKMGGRTQSTLFNLWHTTFSMLVTAKPKTYSN